MRRIRDIAISAAFLVVCCFHCSSQEDVPYSSPLLLDLTTNNCGFNCAVFAASDLRLKITPASLKTNLGLDDQMFSPLSLETMRTVFEGMHIGSVVLGGLDADTLFEILDKNQLAIVHLLSKRGHFVVIRRAGARFEVVNFPARELFTRDRLAEILNKHMTGYALILSPVLSLPKDVRSSGIETLSSNVNKQVLTAYPPVRDVSGHEDVVQNQKIVPAELQHGANVQFLSAVTAEAPSKYDTEVKADANIENLGTKELQVLSVTGECSCFKGVECPITIPPKQKHLVSLRFTRSLFDFVHGTKVAIRSTDALMPAGIIEINPPTFAASDRNVPDLICIPQVITVVRNKIQPSACHFLFLIDKAYPRSLKLTKVLDQNGRSLQFKADYCTRDFYGQDYNAVDLSLPIPKLAIGTNRFLVETDHPRDNKIPLSVIVE